MRFVLLLLISVLFSSCDEVVKQVVKEIKKSDNARDSLAELNADDEAEEDIDYISPTEVIFQRKKEGEDSLHLVRLNYIWGKPYSDSWYRNGIRDGLTTLYHKEGTIFYKVLYKDGSEYTILSALDSKGKPLEFGNLKNGTGKLKYYDPVTDHLISETNYVNGFREGDFLNYYQTGELFRQGFFKDDKLLGTFRVYFKNGSTKESGQFTNGKLEGEHFLYFRSGKVRRFEKWSDEKLSYASEFDRKQNKIKDITADAQNQLTEIIYSYDDNGQLLYKGTYRDGKKYGKYEYFFDKKMKRFEVWSNDTLLKECEWYDNGAAKSIAVYKDNQKDSIYTEYYSNKNLRLRQEYKNGEKDGKYFSYYENGRKYVIGTYEKGEPKGKFDYYDRAGKYTGAREFK